MRSRFSTRHRAESFCWLNHLFDGFFCCRLRREGRTLSRHRGVCCEFPWNLFGHNRVWPDTLERITAKTFCPFGLSGPTMSLGGSWGARLYVEVGKDDWEALQSYIRACIPLAHTAQTDQVCVRENESLVLGRVAEAVDFLMAIWRSICLQTATVGMPLRRSSTPVILACRPSTVFSGTMVDDATYNDRLQ